jgi:RNA-directed DNA polymerase
MSAAKAPTGKAMYVAAQADVAWLRSEQQKLHARSMNQPDYVFVKLWGLVTDPRNLRIALSRVARNHGRHTAGVDGVTVRKALAGGGDAFVNGTRTQLRAGTYRPKPVRRVLIPKAGQPGKFRALGIPTVQDRVVQAALKNILEPIYEADFFPTSYGFRPGRSVHAAIEHLRMFLRPRPTGPTPERRLPYQYAVEGDIKACFDNIDHHSLMERIRRRVNDAKVTRLVRAFLSAGVMEDLKYVHSDRGTPQGGILSPLLANIALAAIEERYEQYVWPRKEPRLLTDAAKISHRAKANRDRDRNAGRPIVLPIRYADDFILLVGAPTGAGQEAYAQRHATNEKNGLAVALRDTLGLELSEAKTLVTPVTAPLRFLGHHIRVRRHPTHGRLVVANVIPRDKSKAFRERIKAVFKRETTYRSLENRLRLLNLMLRGWCSFYRHAWGAKHVFSALDHYVWWTVYRWLRKKHGGASARSLNRYSQHRPGQRATRWTDGHQTSFVCASIRVEQFKLGWVKSPFFAATSMESPVHNERCTPGSEGGARKPTG